MALRVCRLCVPGDEIKCNPPPLSRSSVVPFREAPAYSKRRRGQSSGSGNDHSPSSLSAPRVLLRSNSDNNLNVSQYQQQQQQQQQQHGSPGTWAPHLQPHPHRGPQQGPVAAWRLSSTPQPVTPAAPADAQRQPQWQRGGADHGEGGEEPVSLPQPAGGGGPTGGTSTETAQVRHTVFVCGSFIPLFIFTRSRRANLQVRGVHMTQTVFSVNILTVEFQNSGDLVRARDSLKEG
ncbi:hypothetical protein PBY51_018611 [Eleginops maclovinus]|uniref:Uncharacterized protein n=1 Tax=Eleginops maclovinus TaxID=56733 RepID=A0AAN7Y836_ELEMC|nr:hypothetical protein PBY51_018611 [Eleginops maclovinus]